MNNDAFINKLAHDFGMSRKEVLDMLKQMSNMPEVQKRLRKGK